MSIHHNPQNQVAMFYLKQLAERFVGDCDFRARQVVHAKNMRDVSHAASAVMRGEIRGMPDARAAAQRLTQHATNRMRELLKPHIDELSRCETADDFKRLRAQFIQNDWNFLRGDYASVYHEATRTSTQMLAALERKSEFSRTPNDLASGATTSNIEADSQTHKSAIQPR